MNTYYTIGVCGIVLYETRYNEKVHHKPLQAIHRTEVTNTETYDQLVVRIEEVKKDVELFIGEQERAGKLKVMLLGGNSEGEFYPEVRL